MAQGIFPTPVEPARASGLLRFSVGVAATLVAVDTNDAYYRHAVPKDNDIVHNGYASLPRLVVTKGFNAGTISGSYATLTGVDVFKLKTYGAEAFVSKGFGPFTPYGAIGRQRIDARGDITSVNPTFAPIPQLRD